MTVKWGYDIIDFSVSSATSENTSFPSSNLALPESFLRSWRSTDTTEQIIVLSLGASYNLDCIYLDNCNFTSATIEVNDSDSWTSPNDSQSVTISQDPDTGRYRIWHEPTSTGDTHVRIVIPSQTPVDGESYFKIGRIIIPETVFMPEVNISWGYESEVTKAKRRNEFISGGHETVWLGNHLLWQSSLSWGYYPTDNLNDMKLLNRKLEEDYVLFYENIESDTSKAYYCEKMSEISISRVGYNQNQIQNITLREKT
jgi:hypothetical protein